MILKADKKTKARCRRVAQQEKPGNQPAKHTDRRIAARLRGEALPAPQRALEDVHHGLQTRAPAPGRDAFPHTSRASLENRLVPPGLIVGLRLAWLPLVPPGLIVDSLAAPCFPICLSSFLASQRLREFALEIVLKMGHSLPEHHIWVCLLLRDPILFGGLKGKQKENRNPFSGAHNKRHTHMGHSHVYFLTLGIAESGPKWGNPVGLTCDLQPQLQISASLLPGGEKEASPA